MTPGSCGLLRRSHSCSRRLPQPPELRDGARNTVTHTAHTHTHIFPSTDTQLHSCSSASGPGLSSARMGPSRRVTRRCACAACACCLFASLRACADPWVPSASQGPNLKPTRLGPGSNHRATLQQFTTDLSTGHRRHHRTKLETLSRRRSCRGRHGGTTTSGGHGRIHTYNSNGG